MSSNEGIAEKEITNGRQSGKQSTSGVASVQEKCTAVLPPEDTTEKATPMVNNDDKSCSSYQVNF